jgi:CRISPR system Cascade subunit CasC
VTRTIVDIHVLQTVPPSNLNRDDTGSPKTAVYGGARRSRVSSQAWKRATRVAFSELLDQGELGVRTKRLGELLAERIEQLAPDLGERAAELAVETFKAVGLKVSDPDKGGESGYLVFLSARQTDNLAEAAVAAARAGGKLTEALKARNVKALADRDHWWTSPCSAAWSPTCPTSTSTPPRRSPTRSASIPWTTSTTTTPRSTTANRRSRRPARA